MNALLLALQLAALPAAPSEAGRQPHERTWDQAERAILAFLEDWADAWRQTERGRAAVRGAERLDRDAAVHCHWPPGAEDDYPEHNELIGRIAIASAARDHASCPLWYPAGGGRVGDERQGVDGALAGAFRRSVRLRREELQRELRWAVRRSPGDVRLTGQLVRFALDAGDLDRAWEAAGSCGSDPVQCQLLRGLVLYRRQQVAAADSVFQAAAAAMSPADRCAWNDVGLLLEPEQQASYSALGCAGRSELEARLWWLADPLYGEPGNERRAEHFARKVMTGLVAQLPTDGRQHFDLAKGGDAVVETLIRYGWPAHLYWGGPSTDDTHTNWLAEQGARAATPYVAREYTRGRLHTVPPAAVLAEPFSAEAESWRVTDPGTDSLWWPIEHFARDRGPVVELEGQAVALRRAASTRFVWTGMLDAAPLARPAGAAVRAGLFVAHSPTDGRLAGELDGQVGGRLLVDTTLASGPALIGIELPAEGEAPAARTRFGAALGEPLGTLRGRALSQPLLFEPAADDSVIGADRAIARMYPHTSFPQGSRLGVYWEGYGFAATDTVDVEVRVSGAGPTPAGPAAEPPSAASLRWRDVPGTARASQLAEGQSPVQQRSIVLDVSALAPGAYRLVIAMSSPGTGTVTSERRFAIR